MVKDRVRVICLSHKQNKVLLGNGEVIIQLRNDVFIFYIYNL